MAGPADPHRARPRAALERRRARPPVRPRATRSVFGIGADGSGRDRTREFFLTESARKVFPDWEQDALSLVAELRVQAGRRPSDARLTALVGELSIKSPQFRELWAKHPVREKTHGSKVINHPVAGRLELTFDRLALADDDDATIYVYTAEPGSETAERIALLAGYDATAIAAEAETPSAAAFARPRSSAGSSDHARDTDQ